MTEEDGAEVISKGLLKGGAISSELTEYRHAGTCHLARYFAFGHLPEHLQEISAPCALLAAEMVAEIPDGPELTAGLRKLLEAKDCFVRARLY